MYSLRRRRLHCLSSLDEKQAATQRTRQPIEVSNTKSQRVQKQ